MAFCRGSPGQQLGELLQTCPVYREICISQKLVDAPTAERPVKPL